LEVVATNICGRTAQMDQSARPDDRKSRCMGHRWGF
jgi:hypothetical protein